MKRSPMPPRTTRLRGSAPKRGTGVKKINRKRRAKEFARAYGSAARVAWFKGQRCVVWHYGEMLAEHLGEIECAHVVGGGAGRKADADKVVPMCHAHHAALHMVGVGPFERNYHLNLLELAAQYDAAWRSHCARTGATTTERS